MLKSGARKRSQPIITWVGFYFTISYSMLFVNERNALIRYEFFIVIERSNLVTFF
ncbi:hypothetical protein [Sporosarcina sp. FA9]|uniref:hypothetical protein n=1 Tax=Sporosarcina sp. FA9 TaxID=3413030 RepID=UPI003F656370